MRFAILDLGTNTFNLLIAEDTPDQTYKIILNTKEAVKLGEGGINRKIITQVAFERGLNAIDRHFEKIKSYHVGVIKAYATSAIRDASNGNEFTEALRLKYHLEVSIIQGDKEAELIYLGVKQTLPFSGKKFMILDIGGGSNEFIIADDNQIYWKNSFKLGMARLLEKFRPGNPISLEEIKQIEIYLHSELLELQKQIARFQPEIFIGASGSFDSFVTIQEAEGLLTSPRPATFHEISLDTFNHIYHMLITTTRDDRENMTYLEPVRKDMIVLAVIFVNYILKQFNFETVYQSAYSLKEGAMKALIEGKDYQNAPH